MFYTVTKDEYKSVVVLAGAALDLISLQQQRDYNEIIYCVTLAQYGGKYTTRHPDKRL